VTQHRGLQLVLSKKTRIGDTKSHIECSSCSWAHSCVLALWLGGWQNIRLPRISCLVVGPRKKYVWVINYSETYRCSWIMLCHVIYGINSIFSTTNETKKVKIKSYLTMVFRYMQYVFESRSFTWTQITPIIHFTYMFASIGIVHLVNGPILDRVSFDNFSWKHK
jgi:hypothetical protein